MKRERRYAYLYPDDVEEILAASPICYVPLGAIEWHDAHSPLGTDSFIAEGLCLRMAEETGGVVVPPPGGGATPPPVVIVPTPIPTPQPIPTPSPTPVTTFR